MIETTAPENPFAALPTLDMLIMGGLVVMVLGIFYWRSKRMSRAMQDIARSKQDIDEKLAKLHASVETAED